MSSSDFIINGLVVPAIVVPSFTWTPVSTYTYVSPHFMESSSPRAVSGAPVTFTGTALAYHDLIGQRAYGIGISFVEFRWDFGDGVQAYGTTVTHTYAFPNLQAFTVLRVLDNQGNYWFTRQQMYLG